MDRAEQPRKNSHSLFQETGISKEHRDYENNRSRVSGLVIVLAQPNCGSLLLRDLMIKAGMTRSHVELDTEYSMALVKLFNSPSSNDNMIHYYINCLLMHSASSTGVSIVENIGLDNDFVESFVNMARGIENEHRQVKIVFLTSLAPKSESESKQFESFRQNYELGDLILKKEDLLSDPKSCMIKCNSLYYPNERVIQQVIKEHETI